MRVRCDRLTLPTNHPAKANWSGILRRTFFFLILVLLVAGPIVALYYGADRGLAVEAGIRGVAEEKTGAGMRPSAASLTDRGPFLLGLIGLILLVAAVAYARITANAGLPILLKWRLEPGQGRTLAVVVHGRIGVSLVGDVIAESHANSLRPDVLVIDYPAHLFSNADPAEVARQLYEVIDEVVRAPGKSYERVILIGYSLGALICRRAYVLGCGYLLDRPEWMPARAERAWVGLVDRIILLAGVNRGVSLRPRPAAMGWLTATVMRAFLIFARWTGTARQGRAGEKGTPFVADLRVQWVRLVRERQARGKRLPTVIQLLGTVDDIVSEEDDKDVAVARDFIRLRVNGTGHLGITDFRDRTYGPERRDKFLRALTSTEADIDRLRLENVELPPRVDPEVKHVVFIMHGIRDMADWTSHFEGPLREAFHSAHPGEKVAVELSGYGYFGMGPFLLYSDRQANVRWFMDLYTEVLARYPNADGSVHFIGHSNGTYVLASALERYRTMAINRAVFLGSVVPRD